MKHNPFFQYLMYEKRFSPHTLTAYQSDLQQFYQFLQDTFQMDQPEMVTHQQVRSWVVSLLQKGIQARSVNRKLSTLKTYFKFLHKRGVIDKNPMRKVIAPKTGKRLPVFVQTEGINRLFSEETFSDDFAGVRDRTVLELLYGTGMRRSELIGLTGSDIDFERLQIRVLGKGDKERLIPFGQHLSKQLQLYLKERAAAFPSVNSSLLLTDKGRPLYPKFVYNLVKRYLSQVTTTEQKSPHVLRHTFATHLSDNGADLNAIKELLGHANLAATQIYTHNSIDRLRKVYQQAHPRADEQ